MTSIRLLVSRFGPGFLGQSIVAGVDLAVEKRWEGAQRRARAATGRTLDDKVDSIVRSIRREMVAVGAGTGGVAAVPFTGTITALSSAAAELTWMTARAAELIMAIGALHGHTDADAEERRTWVLAILGFGDDAAAKLTSLVGEAAVIPTTALRSANRRLVSAVVARYGTRRGATALGTAMPFGIGALIGGTANFVGISITARSARKFFVSSPFVIGPPGRS